MSSIHNIIPEKYCQSIKKWPTNLLIGRPFILFSPLLLKYLTEVKPVNTQRNCKGEKFRLFEQ
jgi:hypothetical protein